jgi:hypothetical protein
LTVAEQDTREKAVREAIAASVKTSAPKARVEPVWVMGLVTGENANVLKSADDTTEGGEQRIHAFTVTRIKGTNESAEKPATGTGNPLKLRALPVVLASSMTFRIKGVYPFRHGGDTGDHSENVWKREVEAVVLHLASRPRLGLDHTVTGHAQVQVVNEGFATYGKTLCHVSDLELTVQLVTTVQTS